MYKAFLDIGNSYIKTASIEGGYYQLHEPVGLQELLEEGLETLGLEKAPNEVYFSTVADVELVDALKSLIQSQWQVLPVQLTAQQQSCGLTSGYQDFSKLGDDRWFAMLGAIEICKKPFIVIDAGTATTIDAVVNGEHKGGFIVPGLHTMRGSLVEATADLDGYTKSEQVDRGNALDLLATDTSSAILGGTLYMTAAYINRLILDLTQQLETPFTLFLTGGEAASLLPLIDSQCELISDLVLHGMMFFEESVKKQ